ncbi:CRP-like cAMP-binding protein [Sphingomonas insulae]|uniref:Crp/Fnr family transcriptional regulator n=1 Tax=Sphingomonas insulae TaxID=424800 RepID=A0ABN1HL83_9SPHN|nr:Crp/Fnr family transcriptional regulator [Sphingomonas insulae]NIJ30278.1 CRP-like cAMP-binding protein [Sphingomonas insulae]
MATYLAERLGELIDLSVNERVALERLEQRERTLRRGGVLVREHDRLTELYVLKRGTMMSYVILPDGSRQILRFLFRGDLIAMAGLVYRSSPETVIALTACAVAPLDRSAVADLAVAHPRLSALLVAVGQIERVALTDRLAGLGRTSAKSRVAALLIEIRDRLRTLDPTIDGAFTLGLTQEQIGDATGLTAVHVNRMLRKLEEDGLIARDGGQFTMIDEPGLARTAHHNERRSGLDLGWLPDAR